ncbi:hypothetical protein Ddc_09255 [Ditylenchus destructor]|nr:hypothetical protein Ddc_09255 [Ditylenchus destructor]
MTKLPFRKAKLGIVPRTIHKPQPRRYHSATAHYRPFTPCPSAEIAAAYRNPLNTGQLAASALAHCKSTLQIIDTINGVNKETCACIMFSA